VIEGPGVAAVWDALPEARIVGGAVRDHLAGLAISDVDFAVPLTPEAVIARLERAGLKVVPTGLSHGTVTAMAAGKGFEVTTLRRDVATDGRHAVVAFTDDWAVDASRRDFTINAMSATRDGTVFDYFGGREDLATGRVRFVGVARARIAEDYLRILRYFRFFARYGMAAPDDEAIAGIRALHAGIAQLSAERVWAELKRILAACDPRHALVLMQETGVLPLIVPGARVERVAALVEGGAPGSALLRAAALIGPDVEAFAERSKLSGAEREMLEALGVMNSLTPDCDDARLRRALAREPAEILVMRSWLAGDGSAGWDDLRRRIAGVERPVFPLLGRDVTGLGVPPGPLVGEILREVEAWWMAGGCAADARGCLDYAARISDRELGA